MHVDDLAGACLFLMKNYNSSEIINIGTGEDLSIKELAEKLKKLLATVEKSFGIKPNRTARLENCLMSAKFTRLAGNIKLH